MTKPSIDSTGFPHLTLSTGQDVWLDRHPAANRLIITRGGRFLAYQLLDNEYLSVGSVWSSADVRLYLKGHAVEVVAGPHTFRHPALTTF